MSHIQYKFRSARDYSTTIFDGLSISVADLRQDILRDQKLDPDEHTLVITNEQTGEDYSNEQTLIPKNTTVLVRRVPYTGPRMPRAMNGGGGHHQNQQQRPAGYTAPPFTNGGGGGFAGGHAGYHRGYGPQPNAPVNQYGYRGPQGGGVNVNRNPASENNAAIQAMLEQSDEQWMHQ
ncbi:E3 ubiquitin-protein ligase rbbp6, partial [Coemansia aciculifera]